MAILCDASVKLAVLALPVWLATRRAGIAHARLAHAAWLGLLAAAAALPFLTLWFAPSISLIPARAVSSAVSAVVPGPDLAFWSARGYAVIAAAMLLRLAWSAWQIRRLRRASCPVVATNEREEALVLASAAHHAVLLESAAIAVPATAGASRPSVFLPRGWRNLEQGLVAAIVRHELAHVRRHAYATLVAAEIVKAVFWFHPVAWLACARLRWFEELACDRSAAGADPLAYARALLAMARLASRRTPALALSGGSQLARRVDLLIELTGSPRRGPWWAAGTLAIAVALLALLPFVRVRLDPPPEVAPPADHAAVHALRHGH